jgi:hypothetical protein
MDRLPQELVDRILGYLDRPDLKQTLTVSRKFSYASERCSGVFSTFSLNESNTQRFLDVYANYRRLRLLRHVEFRTYFPQIKYKYEAPCRESRDELRKKDEIFTRQIFCLFTTLQTLQDRAEKAGYFGRIELTIFTPVTDIELGVCLHRRFTSWRVHLMNPGLLPELVLVRTLNVRRGCWSHFLNNDGEEPSKLDWRVLVDLMVKLPTLESFCCKLGGDEWSPPFPDERNTHYLRDWEGPRRDSRHDFATALRTAKLPTTLRHAKLDFLHTLREAEHIDQCEAMPDLVSPAVKDPFSTSLRTLYPHLRELWLRVMADETLFWPDDESAPTWPNLEIVNVLFHIVTPSGAYYFEGPRGLRRLDTAGFPVTASSYPPFVDTEEDGHMDYQREEWGDRRDNASQCHFRVVPTDSTLTPFLAGFARAAANMPSLKEAQLYAPLKWDSEPHSDFAFREDPDYDYEEQWFGENPDYDEHPLDRFAWGITYTAPGVLPFFISDLGDAIAQSNVRKIEWKVAKWRPSAELHRLFQDIGYQQHGEALQEYWNDERWGQLLVDREGFMEEER